MGAVGQVGVNQSVGNGLETWGTGQGTHAKPAEGRFACALAREGGARRYRAEFDEMMETGAPFDIWEGMVAKELLKEVWVDWIYDLRDWQHMITLTFRYPIDSDKAGAIWRALLRRLGRYEIGKNYDKVFGLSYFGYCMGIEYQSRGVLHFHVLADNYVNYKLVHKLWNEWSGFAWIDQVRSKKAVVNYIAKYVLKSGLIDVFIPKKEFVRMTLL